MEGYLGIDPEQIIRDAVDDERILGFGRDEDGTWFLDRRYDLAATGLNPRTADLNLIGPAILPVPDYLVEELGLNQPR